MKDQNYFIDFLKFIFSIIIMFYHSWVFAVEKNEVLFYYGYMAVNFYFIVTGYLMMNSLEKNNKSTFDFIKNKILRLLPGILVTFFICYAFTYGRKGLDIELLFSNDVISDLLQLRVVGMGGAINAAWWYLSAMLFVLFLLYPLARKFRKKYIQYVIPILIFVTLAVIEYYDISMSYHSGLTFIFINGFYKGLIYIALGNISYELAKYFRNLKFDKLKIMLITIIETLIYMILIANMHFNYIGTIWCAILFVIGVSITFCNQSLTSSVFKSKFWNKLGNYGFYLYLTHVSIRTYFERRNSYIYYDMLPKYIFISLLVALFVYIVLEYIYPFIQKYMKKDIVKV